jgi:hypothetical protein
MEKQTYEQLCTYLENQPREIAGDDYHATAGEWADTGLEFDDCVDYIEVGVFCPSSARILSDQGIEPEQLDHFDEEYGHTLGWRYANSDISLDALKRAIA